MFAVVEEQEHPASLQRTGKLTQRRVFGRPLETECGADRRGHGMAVVEIGQLHPVDAVFEAMCHVSGQTLGQPGLTHAADSDECEKAAAFDQRAALDELECPADEARRLLHAVSSGHMRSRHMHGPVTVHISPPLSAL